MRPYIQLKWHKDLFLQVFVNPWSEICEKRNEHKAGSWWIAGWHFHPSSATQTTHHSHLIILMKLPHPDSISEEKQQWGRIWTSCTEIFSFFKKQKKPNTSYDSNVWTVLTWLFFLQVILQNKWNILKEKKKKSNQAQSCYIRLFTLCNERKALDKCVLPAITFRHSCTIDALWKPKEGFPSSQIWAVCSCSLPVYHPFTCADVNTGRATLWKGFLKGVF